MLFRSGFHGFGTSDQIPFYTCGWATYKGSWGGTEYGVAFRVNRDCFNGRDAILYYMDGDFWGDLSADGKKRLQEIRDGIERYSSGLTDVKICEIEEPGRFRFRGIEYSPTRLTVIQFKLDSSKIKDTVELSEENIPSSELGGYVFILPRAGEFYIELGEMLDGERIPLHYDGFCMK